MGTPFPGRLMVIPGRNHLSFARRVCEHIDNGASLHTPKVKEFANKNTFVSGLPDVRGEDVFVIATMSPVPAMGLSVNDCVMELFIMIHALSGASAGRITAVLPCLPYARSDKKDRPRISITARLMADMLQTAGADRVLTMDLHSPQIQGFFQIPVDQLEAAPVLCDYIRNEWNVDSTTHVLVAGDAGEAKELGKFANRLHLPMAVVDKRRVNDDDKAVATNLIGDVSGKRAIIVDDEIATGGTICEAGRFILDRGALSVSVVATHGVLCGQAIERINIGPFDHVVVTDTVMPFVRDQCPTLTTVSVAGLFAKAIERIHHNDSVSALFQ